MTNKHRGEVPLEVGDKVYTLCLTLGALAEIETALGVSTIRQVFSKLYEPSTGELTHIIGALMRGGGHEIDEDALKSLPLMPGLALEAIGEAFRSAGFMTDPGEAAEEKSAGPEAQAEKKVTANKTTSRGGVGKKSASA